MGALSIRAEVMTGPLSISLLDGDGVELRGPVVYLPGDRPLVFEDLTPGRYVIRAARPDGSTFARSVNVDRTDAHLEIDPPDVRRILDLDGRPISEVRPGAEMLRTLGAFDAVGDRLGTGSQLAHRGWIKVGGNGAKLDRRSETRTVVLRRWSLDRYWKTISPWTPFDRVRVEDDVLSYSIHGGAAHIQAIGLLDETGFGPIVIVPPFRGGLTLTFLASGVVTSNGAQRAFNPSALRVPVATCRPDDNDLAGLLSGLSASSFAGGRDLWNAVADRTGFGDADFALEALLHKRMDPAAAVLAAHYLLRFAPERLPVAWLQNLCRVSPRSADPPTLLAWRLILEGEGSERDRRQVTELFRMALKRPVHLFGRSRALLSQGSRLFGPYRRRRAKTLDEGRRPRSADFLNVAASAGGLEAFWGSSPSWPWVRERLPFTPILGPQFTVSSGGFE